MSNVRGNRTRRLIASFGPLLLLPVLLIALLAAAGLVRVRAGARQDPTVALAAGPANATILHVRATHTVTGAKGTPTTLLEAWLDRATNEGKIVETTTAGTVKRIESFSGGTYTLYLGDARHAVIRRGLRPNGPYTEQIRDELLRYQVSLDRGVGQAIGSGQTGGRASNRVRLEIEGVAVLADIDPNTGLTLREEMSQPGGAREIRDTTYSVVESVARTDLTVNSFQPELPANISREEYADDQGAVLASGAGVSYAVYAAPSSIGSPVASFHRASGGPSVPTSDTYYLIYSTADGEVQVLSGLPPDTAAKQAKDPLPANTTQAVEIAGVTWEVGGSGGKVQAHATLDDAYVTIYAPNQATFERVVRGLQRLRPKG